MPCSVSGYLPCLLPSRTGAVSSRMACPGLRLPPSSPTATTTAWFRPRCPRTYTSAFPTAPWSSTPTPVTAVSFTATKSSFPRCWLTSTRGIQGPFWFMAELQGGGLRRAVSGHESSIRGSGFHRVNDLYFTVIPQQHDDFQEAACRIQPDSQFALRVLVIQWSACQR